jgi:hypothetical protein
MAFDGNNLQRVGRLFHYFGYAHFATSGTDVEVNAGMKVIKHWNLAYEATPAVADGCLYLNETVASNGEVTVDADGEVTISRVAGTTSALGIRYEFWGY